MRLSITVLFGALLLISPQAAAQTVPPIVAAAPEPADMTRDELLRRAREAKKDVVTEPRPNWLEALMSRIEPMVMPSALPAALRGASYRRGFYPTVGSVAPGGGWAVGPGYRYEGLAGGALDADVFARYSWKRYWMVEGRLAMPRFNDGRTVVSLMGRVRDMPQEDFFGFGPDSAEPNRVNFGLRELSGGVRLEQRLQPFAIDRWAIVLHAGTDLVSPSTRSGSDAKYPSIEALFDVNTIPGFVDEPNFVVLRGGALFDRTDFPFNPRRGPQYRVELSRWASRGGAPSTFNALTVDLRQYIPFMNESRVIALRGALWHTDPVSGAEVPLYNQPVLGGGRALRGYREFRFRDRSAMVLQAEYRYRLTSGFDGVIFYEAGTVGRSLGDLGSLKTDYGLGIRASTKQGIIMRIEAAFGTPEGPRFFIKFGDAF